jgi:hypothetical protein
MNKINLFKYFSFVLTSYLLPFHLLLLHHWKSLSTASRSSIASWNSPSSSKPSPTSQWTKALKHQILFMVKSREDLSDSSRVRDHTDSSHNLSEITTRDNSKGLIVNSTFESSRAPVNELNCSFSLDGSKSGIDIFGDGTTSPLYIIQQAIYFPCLGSHLAMIEAG